MRHLKFSFVKESNWANATILLIVERSFLKVMASIIHGINPPPED